MAHRYSQTGYSAADAYSPTLSSSFTTPTLASTQPHQQVGNAAPLHNAGDEEDDDDSSEDWNVYDDFNNKRPLPAAIRSQSSLYQNMQGRDGQAESYDIYQDNPEHRIRESASRAINQQKRPTLIPSGAFGFDARNGDPNFAKFEENPSTNIYRDSTELLKEDGKEASGIELVTVPALGNEFTNEEVRAMKKPHKRKRKARAAGTNARRWVKTEDRYFGCFSPIGAVFFIFISLASLGILLYFVIPRVPAFAVQTVTPLVAVPDGASMVTHHSPTNFSMNMKINLRADNSGGWIPTKVTNMDLKVYDISTSKLVGTGILKDQTFPGRKRTPFQFPVSFAYASLNVTGDATYLHWINACGPEYANTPRQSLNLQLSISMSIQGLIGSKGTSTSLTDLTCPFTLQPNQT